MSKYVDKKPFSKIRTESTQDLSEKKLKKKYKILPLREKDIKLKTKVWSPGLGIGEIYKLNSYGDFYVGVKFNFLDSKQFFNKAGFTYKSSKVELFRLKKK